MEKVAVNENVLPKNVIKSNEKINLNRINNNKGKTYNEKIKKSNFKKNVKRYNKPFPIPDLIISNNIKNNKNKNLNGNKNSNLIQNKNHNCKILVKRVFNYFINEFLPVSLKHYCSPIKGEIIHLNDNKCNFVNEVNVNLKNDTLCIVVSNKNSIKTCWNNGFFGKGNLSRSEPNWTERILKDIIKKHSGIYNRNFENYINENKHESLKSDENKTNSHLFVNKLIETKESALKLCSKSY